MATDPKEQIAVFDRETIAKNYRRSRLIRNPSSDVGPGTDPQLDSLTFADQAVVLYGNAQSIGEAMNLRSTFGKRLEQTAEEEGLNPPRLPAAGGLGFVRIAAAAGGANVLAGAVAVELTTGLRFRATVTGTYADAAPVPLAGVDTGPETNLAPGTVLTWQNPPIGAGPTVTVIEQADGSGLSGGREVESDAELQQRIADKRANPPSAGNSAAYIEAVESLPNVAVQKAFAYPAIKGPGTCGVAFTLRPARPGGSRVPNGAELAAATEELVAAFPEDDGILVAALAQQPVTCVLKLQWARSAAGWVDATPWPAYVASSKVCVSNAAAITATSFRASTATTTTAPQVGQTIALYDAAAGRFRRKRIATVTQVTAGKVWDLTFATANAASDTSFVPASGAAVSPWSDSLDSLVAPVASHFDTLGPGEQVSVLPDPGRRMRREPESPAAWPSVVSNRLLGPVFALDTVADAALVEPTVPYATTVGTPGALSYLLSLGGLAAFPL